MELADPPQRGSLAGEFEALGERVALRSDAAIADAALLGLTAELDSDAGCVRRSMRIYGRSSAAAWR